MLHLRVSEKTHEKFQHDFGNNCCALIVRGSRRSAFARFSGNELMLDCSAFLRLIHDMNIFHGQKYLLRDYLRAIGLRCLVRFTHEMYFSGRRMLFSFQFRCTNDEAAPEV